jgi:DNA recombination protein RmuC
MNEIFLAVLIIVGLVAFGLITFYLTKKYFSQTSHQNIEKLSDRMFSQLNEITRQVNDRLRENTASLQQQRQDLNSRLDNTQKIVNSVTNKLATLEESSKRIFEVGKDITSLQDILKAPKLRGGLGEYVLADILKQILPQDNYALQYEFRNHEKVDAIIKLKNMLIPIDAKFPLENFEKIIKTTNEKIQKKAHKQFLRDVKKHIEAISNKYIRPDEGTSDFALMYVPAENIYYEIILKEKGDKNITNFALARKVIPVSPNSFYAYLQAILIGLKGLQIEKGAQGILANLGKLKLDFNQFGEDFGVLGKHLSYANNVYEKSQKKLEKFSDKLEEIESPAPPKILSNKKRASQEKKNIN